MKKVVLTLIATSFIFGFVGSQELSSYNHAVGEFTILEKPHFGN
ncbi:hypothetical protein P4637_09415 [Halalkalibacterium halodurans]|nr:hypothetical protein [Halalkalibacterium halodurans]MED4085053.1 hypothetical protein [Halalkalibacterium halodurans]MED4105926.1 hypothetical protein [Halalkalibacterium halodurans]MED4111131.1 hypothetical protein [Halalkalibacterium halodurans]MED4148108.1 hypothetical protein [Halalkalibacterium halodurans]